MEPKKRKQREQKYKIGQILYVALNAPPKVIPVMVVEEITKKTLDIEETVYVVETHEGQRVDLSKMNGNTFDSIKKCSEHLMLAFEKAIEKIMCNAEELRKSKWLEETVEPVITTKEELATTEESEYVLVELPDGTMARVRAQL
jgi:hypothetical protein